MLSRSDLEALGSLSQRAQIAYALSCIEATVRAYDLRGDAFDEWNERAWRRTSAPKSDWREPPWPRNFAEIDALLDPAVGGWGEGVADVLRKVFELAANACEELLERDDAAVTLRALVTELARRGIDAPAIGTFVRSPSTEMAGVGRTVPPCFFRGIERESFAESMASDIQTGSRSASRGAAFAARHVGIGSSNLVRALGDAMFSSDRELALLAEDALQVLVSPTDFTEILRRKKGEKMVAVARSLMKSERAEDRVDGAKNAGEALFLDIGLYEDLRELLLHDRERSVRVAAARAMLNPKKMVPFARSRNEGLTEEDLIVMVFSPLREIRRLVCVTRSRDLIALLLAGISEGHGGLDPIRRVAGILEIETGDITGSARFMLNPIATIADSLLSRGDEEAVLLSILQRSPALREHVVERLSKIVEETPEMASAAVEARARLVALSPT